jgi:CBS domain-containing protein
MRSKIRQCWGKQYAMRCQRTFGVLDRVFFVKVSARCILKKPICLSEESSLLEVVEALQKNKIGSVLLVDKGGALRGDFYRA